MKQRLETNWRNKSIEDLENLNFGNPNEAPTGMVKRCLELCKVPLTQFSVEDLRLMIGQGFSLRYLVPLAIEHLHKDVFAEGDFYTGDLLKNVLSVDTKFWIDNRYQWDEINDLVKDRRSDLAAKKIVTTLFDAAFDR